MKKTERKNELKIAGRVITRAENDKIAERLLKEVAAMEVDDSVVSLQQHLKDFHRLCEQHIKEVYGTD